MKRSLSMSNRASTLALAVALVAGATPASAQFVGTIDSSAGIDTANSTNSNLIITGQQAVINWTANGTPNGGQIAFLPDGNSATFNGTADFAVLNRVTPGTAGNAIYMGGNQLVHAYSSNKATGVTQLDGWWKPPTGYGRIS